MKHLPPDDVVLDSAKDTTILPTLLVGAIVVAALYYGQELMVPLVLAALLAFVLAPACALLQKIKLPRVLAVLAVVLLTFALLGGLGTIVGRQVGSLAASLPAYQTTINTKWTSLTAKMGAVESFTKDIGDKAGAKPGESRPGNPPAAAKPAAANEGSFGNLSGLTLAKTFALPILGPLGTAGVMLVFTFFILVSHEDLRDRLVRLVGRHDLHRTILAMNDAAGRLSRFFLFQLALNATFGLVIGVALWFAGLPNPLLWGILAAVMRFVPFIGVVVAAVPPLLLAIAIVPGWSLALVVLGLFAGAEGITGQVIEPLIYGHNTGLSPIAIIVATAFWALIWGPIGLLIATPLTVCVVVIGRHVEALGFLDVILGDEPPLEPYETFYQRALEGKAMALVPSACKRIAASSFAEYYDNIALPGLALAQGDLARDDAAFERLDAIHLQIEQLLAAIQSKPGLAPMIDAAPSHDLRSERAIVCVPGRGQLDDLAAFMAVHALTEAGFGAVTEPNLILGARGDAMPSGLSDVRLCCLSILEDGTTSAAIRYFIKRVQKQMPHAAIVVCLWHANRESPILTSLRTDGGDAHLVLSIGELLAFCKSMTRVPVGDMHSST